MYGSSYMFRHYIANILSTAPQLSISHKALGMLPEDGNVMPISDRHVPHHWTQHTHPQYSIDCFSIEHLSEGTRNPP